MTQNTSCTILLPALTFSPPHRNLLPKRTQFATEDRGTLIEILFHHPMILGYPVIAGGREDVGDEAHCCYERWHS